MSSIFIGFLFVFLHFNINLGFHTINLIPDFIGYIFIFKGLKELTYASGLFEKARPYAFGMGVFTGIVFILNLLGIWAQMGWVNIILSLIGTIVLLYISYLIVCGIEDIEINRNVELNGRTLKSTWKLVIISRVAVFASMLIPIVVVGFFSIIFCFIVLIVFLVQLYKAKSLYEALSTLMEE